jgi:selenium metabolism protein YedF
METLDCRGLACPLPVMRVRDRIASRPGEPFVVLVDNPAAVENVSRFVTKGGGTAAVTPDGDGGATITVSPSGSAPAVSPVAGPPGGVVVLVSRETFGEGDKELGELLAKGFFHTLLEAAPLPGAIICINRGVMLSTTPGQIADDLAALASRGVAILSCGTCLAHYGRKDALLAGRVSNMYEITEALMGASSVVPL